MERTYFQPADLKEALSILATHPEARIVAAGTDLVVGARSGKNKLPQSLLAIHRLAELDAIQASSDGGLQIGALVTHGDLEASSIVQSSWTALADAAALVGSPATRHVATIGGNICNASPAMEVGSPLLVFDATVELTSSEGSRPMPFGSFVTGPGENMRRPNEIVKAIVLPALPSRGTTGSAYIRLEYRRAMEIAVVGAAAFVTIDEGELCTAARIALTAVAPTCLRAFAAERVLTGEILSTELLERAARSAVEIARPIDDVRGSAEYRRAMVPVIVFRALRIAWDRATSQRSK